MPSADDKVVLQVKIDVADSKKQWGEFSKTLKGVAGKTKGITDATDKSLKQQLNLVGKLGSAWEKAGKKAEGAEKAAEKAANKATTALKKEQAELKKTGGMFEKMGKAVQKFTKDPVVKGIAKGTWDVGKRVGGAVAGVGAHILGFGIGGITGAYGTYQQVQAAKFGMTGMGATRAGMSRAARRGMGMGFKISQTYPMAIGAARAVGMPESITTAQQLAQGGGGMDVGQAIGIMGMLRQAGVTFGAQARPGGATTSQMQRQQDRGTKTLSRLIEGGFISGLEKARLPEYLQGVAQIAEQVGGRQVGRVNVKGIGAGMAWLGQVPGMQGRRGLQMAQRLDQMIRAPGGGEAGQQLMMQAMGFGKPGGSVSFYEATKRQQRGFFGKGGAENLMNVFREVTEQYGVKGAGGTSESMEEANLVLSQISGLTLDQVEGLQEIMNSGKDQKEKLAKIKEAMEEGKPLPKRQLEATRQGFASMATRLAGIEAKTTNIGGKMAKTMEELQDLQFRVLKLLASFMQKYGPEINAGIKKIGDFVEGIFRMLADVTGKRETKYLSFKGGYGRGGKVLYQAPRGADTKQLIDQIQTQIKQLTVSKAEALAAPQRLELESKGWTFGKGGKPQWSMWRVSPGEFIKRRWLGKDKAIQREALKAAKSFDAPLQERYRQLSVAKQIRSAGLSTEDPYVRGLFDKYSKRGTIPASVLQKAVRRMQKIESKVPDWAEPGSKGKYRRRGRKPHAALVPEPTETQEGEEGGKPSKLASAETVGRRKVRAVIEYDAPSTTIPYGHSAGRKA